MEAGGQNLRDHNVNQPGLASSCWLICAARCCPGEGSRGENITRLNRPGIPNWVNDPSINTLAGRWAKTGNEARWTKKPAKRINLGSGRCANSILPWHFLWPKNRKPTAVIVWPRPGRIHEHGDWNITM